MMFVQLGKSLRGMMVMLLLGAALAAPAQEKTPSGKGLPNVFYAMDTGTDSRHLSADAQAALVKELGFAGIDIVYRDLPQVREMLAAVDNAEIKLYSIFFPIFIERGQPVDLGKLEALCPALKGRQTIVMLALNSKSYKHSSHEGDQQAIEALRQAAAIAQASGVRLAVYPHFSSWVERVDHAVALVKAAGRRNLGVVFNLCHFLKTDGTQLEARVREAMPVLFAVTVNGADRDGAKDAGWGRLIMPLDRGDYDVAEFLAVFVKAGFRGQIGLQHYGIGGDAKENLRRSMGAWKKISVRAAQLSNKQ